MKVYFPIILFIFFSSFIEINNSKGKIIQHSKITSCPNDLREAREDLNEYLSKENVVEDLREKYNLHIYHTAQNKIYSLQSELDQDECKKLIENSPWLENTSRHAFYKVNESYFIITYSETEKGDFKRQGISIFNEQFERVAMVIDI